MISPIKIAFITGTLGTGGAEKQFYYLLKCLTGENVILKVFCLTRGEYYEKLIKTLDIEITWIGQQPNPLLRLKRLIKELSLFQPQIIQSTHFFTNFYASFSAPFVNACSIGTLRSNVNYDVNGLGITGRLLINLPKVLIVNSKSAFDKLSLRNRKNLFLLNNVIDLDEFDLKIHQPKTQFNHSFILVTTARLSTVKRIDRFLKVIHLLNKKGESVTGWIIGDGSEKGNLVKMARDLDLSQNQIKFWGMRQDVAELLSQADLYLSTSDHEGLPNAVMEAMAANLPVITTPAGDCPVLVRDNHNGFVVDYDDLETMADKILILVKDREKRLFMGKMSRKLIEDQYTFNRLNKNIINIYAQILTQGYHPNF